MTQINTTYCIHLVSGHAQVDPIKDVILRNNVPVLPSSAKGKDRGLKTIIAIGWWEGWAENQKYAEMAADGNIHRQRHGVHANS